MSAPSVVIVVSEPLMREFFGDDGSARLHAAAERLHGDLPGPAWERVDALADAGNLSECRVLVTSWGTGPLDRAVLGTLPRLGLVAHTGASIRPFATDALFDRGVVVTQAGTAMARPVAEVSLAFTLALLHRIPHMHDALRTRDDGWSSGGGQHEILGAPITVIGASRTGRAYLDMIRALGARASVVDPTLSADAIRELGAEPVSLADGLRKAQIVALHAPSLPETQHLIGRAELALMRDGAGLVNTARSWLVDEAALAEELTSGRLSAALDVFDEEPLPPGSPFRHLPNVLATPHRAAGTVEGRRRQGRIVADELSAFATGEPLRHTVSREQLAVMA